MHHPMMISGGEKKSPPNEQTNKNQMQKENSTIDMIF